MLVLFLCSKDTMLRRERLEQLNDYLFECACTRCARAMAKKAATPKKKAGAKGKAAAKK